MGIKDFFKPKPAWRSSNAQKRKDAVAALVDQMIIRHLAEHDPDAEVRAAAIRKIEPQQALYDFIIAMGKSNAFADLNIRAFAISCLKDRSLLANLFDEDSSLNRRDLQEIIHTLRDSAGMKRFLKNATPTEFIWGLKEQILTGEDLADAENSALAAFADRASKNLIISNDAVHLAAVLSAQSLLRVLREMKPELARLREQAWIALFNKTINSDDAASMNQTAEYCFMQEEWSKIKQQADSLHFSEEQCERIRSDVKRIGRHPANSIQWSYLHQVVENTPKAVMTGHDLGDKNVTLTIQGTIKLPALPEDKNSAYQLAGLSTDKLFPFETIRFFTGFPLVCAKCGKPMTRLVLMAGHSCLNRSFVRVQMVADNAQEIFYNMNHLRELIAVPSCGICDVSQGVFFKDRHLNTSNSVNLSHESNFYTNDEQMAANLHRNGFLVEKFRFENRNAIPQPLKFVEPQCLFCGKTLVDIDREAPLIGEGRPVDACMDCRNQIGDENIHCHKGHIIKVTHHSDVHVSHECILCNKSTSYIYGEWNGDSGFDYRPCKGKK